MPTVGPPRRLPPIPLHRQTLANGLQIAVVERRELPIVHVEIVIASGADLDVPASAGRASMTAEMIDEGTPARAALEIAEQLDFLGAHLDVQPGWDATTISLDVLSARLDPALEIVADLVLNAAFPSDEYERKRKERLSALLLEHAEPALLAGKALAAGVFGRAHSYSAPISGTHAALATLEREEVEAFYLVHYRPANALVIVVGDVDTAAIVAAIADRLGSWSGAAQPMQLAQVLPTAPRHIRLVDKPLAAQAELRVGHAGPPRDTADYFALRAMNTMLGGSFTARLNTILRERMGVTYGAHSSFRFRRRGGLFSAGAAVFTEAAARSAQVVVEEMNRLATDLVPADELRRAQSYIALGLPRSFESSEDIAARLREQLLYGLADDYWQTYVDRVFAVSREQVRDSAARHLQSDQCVIAVVADRNDVQSALEQSRLGDVLPTTVET